MAGGIAVDTSYVYNVVNEYISGWKWRIEKRSLATGGLLWSRAYTRSASTYAYDIAVGDAGAYAVGEDYTPGNAQWRIEKREITPPNCTGPFAASWTDPTITANSTKIRKVHIDELRTAIDFRRTDAGLSVYSWTDPTITANSTKIRKVHIDELRSAISGVYTTCGQAAPSWTDPTITADSTKIRKVHIDELRSAVGSAK